jgi:serine/threonine-protein kinase RsbW
MSSSAGPEIIRLTMPSRLELLGVLDRVVSVLCERLEFDVDTSSKVTLSVIEAGTNAIQHGHKRDASKPFDVSFEVHDDWIEITVHDTGKGFVPEAQNGDITSPEHLLDARGRGLYIMRACMDSVDFRFGPFGTECHLIKRRPAAAV